MQMAEAYERPCAGVNVPDCARRSIAPKQTRRLLDRHQAIEQRSRGGEDQIPVIGDDEVEFPYAVVAGALAGEHAAGELAADHDDVPLADQRIVGRQRAARGCAGPGASGMPSANVAVRIAWSARLL